MNKCHFKNTVDFIHLPRHEVTNGIVLYNSYMINKNSAMKIIGQNKEIFTLRLGLHKDTSVDEIYSKMIKKFNDGGRYNHDDPKNKWTYDLEGMILGFPKHSSMIFNLEVVSEGYPLRRAGDIEQLSSKMLEILNAPDSLYKDLSPKEKNLLTRAIKKMYKGEEFNHIDGKSYYGDSLYTFIKYTDEPEEIQRIANSTYEFEKNFKTSKFI